MLNEDAQKVVDGIFGKPEEPTPKITTQDLKSLFQTKLKTVKDFDDYYNLVKEVVFTKDVVAVPHNAKVELVVTVLAEASPFELTSEQIANLVALVRVFDNSQRRIAFDISSARFRTIKNLTLLEALSANDYLFSVEFSIDLLFRVYSKELPKALLKLNPATNEDKFIAICERFHKRGILPKNTNHLYSKLFEYINNQQRLNNMALYVSGIPYCDEVQDISHHRSVARERQTGKSIIGYSQLAVMATGLSIN